VLGWLSNIKGIKAVLAYLPVAYNLIEEIKHATVKNKAICNEISTYYKCNRK
jgi:hypothetical protein